MFNKIFAFSLLIGAVTAQLRDGVYRILDPEINSLGYVAKSGNEIGTPVTLGLSRLNDLHELVSFLVSDMLIKLILMRCMQWVVKRIPHSPPGYYSLLNIGQDKPTYATDHVSTAQVVYLPDGCHHLLQPRRSPLGIGTTNWMWRNSSLLIQSNIHTTLKAPKTMGFMWYA